MVVDLATADVYHYDQKSEEFILINEEKAPGNYEVEFESKDIASGVYIYKLQAGSFTQSKKMILLR